MSVRVSEVGAESLSRVNKILAGIPGGIWKATYAALKRAGDTAKTRAGQFAAAEYTINKSDFMKKVHQKSHITSEAGGVVSMSVSYAGNVIPLLSFNTKYSRNGLLQTQVKRSGASTVLEHAFAAKVFGPIGVFERLGERRFPVEQKYGPSTAHMMSNENVVEKMDDTVRETFERRLEHEITRVLNGWGGKS
ncbi:MAG: hypothetical protein K9L62_00425 [Vallitaleaceae bacterium]|nr:hypothetical protein [Vallitaleaceae bacterium]